MAAAAGQNLNNIQFNTKNERVIMNKLRDSGMEYISSSGRYIAAKVQPEQFCHCPQKCQEKLTPSKWKKLFTQFYELADQNLQNQFLQSHIVIKAVHLHNWENDKSCAPNKRRVTCKYHVPDLNEDSHLKDYLKSKSPDTIEICQKAFMNVFGITEKRVRMQRERCISKLAPNHYKNSYNSKKSEEVLSEEASSTVSDKSKDDEPLDLSQRAGSQSKNSLFDKARLYEMAEKMGVSREAVDKELSERYEKFLQQNLKKQQRSIVRKKRRLSKSMSDPKEGYLSPKEGDDDDDSYADEENHAVGVSEQVLGLQEDLTILPIQTLNNGDLTITPVLGPVERPVENQDIMLVNHFFQNQLWQPEYIGLSNVDKLWNQKFEV